MLLRVRVIKQQLCHPCQGESGAIAGTLSQALTHAVQHRRRHQVAGCVIESLHRQGDRYGGVFPLHAGFRQPTAHLHQAVETTPSSPRATPAIGVEANVDQSRR
ncbi:hypothetical protein D3C78_1183820 [compost metagenome]